MKKFFPLLSKCLLFVILLSFGLGLVSYSSARQQEFLRPYQLHSLAQLAVKQKDMKLAYTLYLQSSYEFADPKMKAMALYEAATVGWAGNIANYKMLVTMHQEALRYNPEHYAASFNLEYLYFLKENMPKLLPEPTPGEQPSREGEVTSGDV